MSLLADMTGQDSGEDWSRPGIPAQMRRDDSLLPLLPGSPLLKSHGLALGEASRAERKLPGRSAAAARRTHENHHWAGGMEGGSG